MFYFPLIVTTYPDWFPIWGGQEFIFFSPVFNFADANISVAIVLVLLFFRKEIGSIGNARKEGETESNMEGEVEGINSVEEEESIKA